MFSTNASPIAIDFGTSSVKLLQIVPGDRPQIFAAADLPIPESIRFDPEALPAFYSKEIPKLLTAGGFKGRRAVIAIPSAQTFIQHMQLVDVPGTTRDDLIKSQLQSQMGCSPQSIIVRSVDVADVHRDGQARSEIICFAIARDTVMRYMTVLRRARLNVVGVHTEAMAMVRAFDYINRRETDSEVTTLYVDIGWGGTHVAIAHGRQMVFARYIQLGGRHFDHHIAQNLHCDTATARAHRLAVENAPKMTEAARRREEPAVQGAAILSAAAAAHAAGEGRSETAVTDAPPDRRSPTSPATACYQVPKGSPPTRAANVDLTELIDTMADELSMCLRYHKGLFPTRSINRSIFLGGEARQVWLCQHVVKALRLPAQLGDPLSRLSRVPKLKTPGLDLDEPQPGWAVNYGLCTGPTEL